MSATTAAHTRIEELVALVNDFLPDGYVLGYELIHTDVSDAERIRADHEIKAHWRDRLGRENKPGAADDMSAIPGDASTVAGTHVLFEVFHLPTGLHAVRTVPMDTLISLAEEYAGANATRKTQIRTIVKSQLQGFYDLCAARVDAASRP